MNTSSHNLEAQLDRLVDGELPPAEYRSLLASLEDQPDGWRRCATAFLEAQAFGRDLSAIRQSAATVSIAAVPAATIEQVHLPAGRSDDWSHRTWQGLYFATIAASLALAFYVGSWTSGMNNPSGPLIADHQTTPQVERPDIPSPASVAQRETEPSPAPRTDAPLGNVRLVMDGGETSQGVDVPVYSPQQVERWRSVNKPVLPPAVIEQLRQAGHKVSHRQQYLLLDTADGRQVIVPVDDYQIQPPRRGAY